MDEGLKNIITDIINKFMKLLDVSIFGGVAQQVMQEQYNKGIDTAGIQFDMNFLPDPERVNLLKNYTFENIKDMNEDIANKLRKRVVVYQ